MSWFEYGTPKSRKVRKGVWLRVRCLPQPILDTAKKIMRTGENIEWVIVKEIRPNNQVYLEFWCKEYPALNAGIKVIKQFFAKQKKNPLLFNRYAVFGFVADEDPTWICEGDLGRGCPD